MAADVFMSYARKDIDRARLIKDRLEELGLTVFFDVEGLDSGDVFPDVLDREVKSAGAIVGVWSTHSLTRPWVKIECDIGRARGVLVPVQIEEISPLDRPAAFWNMQFDDLSDFDGDPNHSGWLRLVRSLARTLNRPELIRPTTGMSPIASVGAETRRVSNISRPIADQTSNAAPKSTSSAKRRLIVATTIGVALELILSSIFGLVRQAWISSIDFNYTDSQLVFFSWLIGIPTLLLTSIVAFWIAKRAALGASAAVWWTLGVSSVLGFAWSIVFLVTLDASREVRFELIIASMPGYLLSLIVGTIAAVITLILPPKNEPAAIDTFN